MTKKIIKFPFLESDDCKYLCHVRKLFGFFFVLVWFKPCFLTIMATALQNIERERGENLWLKCPVEVARPET